LDKASGQGLAFQFNNSRVRFFRACLFLAFIVYILTDKINIRENIMEVSVFPEMHYTYQKEKKRKWKSLQTSFETTSHSPSLANIRNSRELSTFSSCKTINMYATLIFIFSHET
jgi:hypothetical protein